MGEDEINLRELVDIVVAGRWLIAAITALALAGGLAYGWAAIPVYKADALVQIERKKQTALGSPEEFRDLLIGRTEIATEIELLKSRLVLGSVVDQLQLTVLAAPRYFPWVGRSFARRFEPVEGKAVADAPLGLRRYAWGGEKINVATFAVPDSRLDSPFTLRAGAAGTYTLEGAGQELINAGRVGEPAEFATPDGLGQLFVRELLAEPGAEFTLVSRRKLRVIGELASRLQVNEQGRQSGILAVSLDGTDRARAAQLVNAIITTYQRQNVEHRSAEAEQTLKFVNEQLPRVRKELDAAEDALNRYRLTQKSVDLTKETEIVLQQAVTLEQSRLELRQKREEMLRRFTPSHPVMETLEAQLAQVASRQQAMAAQIQGLPQTQQELLRLSRDIEVGTKLYATLLNNAEQLQIAKAGMVGNVRVVDYAVEPFAPIGPVKSLSLGLSLMLGLMLGVAAVFARKALTKGITDAAEVERALNLPTYAAIPYSREQRRIAREIERGGSSSGILAKTDPNSHAIEAIRSLRTALHMAAAEASNNILMISGPSPNVGKSFVTVNLGASLAMTGRRTVVIDADLRRGHLHQFAALPRSLGLTDFIASRCELNQIVHTTPQKDFYLIPTGAIPPDPSELLLNPRLELALRQLSKEYDSVIVDSAPVLAVTDAVVVGRLAGTILLVIKSGQHSARELEDTVKRLNSGGAPVHGVVINQIGLHAAGSYGYKSGYYHYQYYAAGGKKRPGTT